MRREIKPVHKESVRALDGKHIQAMPRCVLDARHSDGVHEQQHPQDWEPGRNAGSALTGGLTESESGQWVTQGPGYSCAVQL